MARQMAFYGGLGGMGGGLAMRGGGAALRGGAHAAQRLGAHGAAAKLHGAGNFLGGRTGPSLANKSLTLGAQAGIGGVGYGVGESLGDAISGQTEAAVMDEVNFKLNQNKGAKKLAELLPDVVPVDENGNIVLESKEQMFEILGQLGERMENIDPQQIELMQAALKGDLGNHKQAMMDMMIGSFFPGWKEMSGGQKLFTGLAFGAGIVGLISLLGGNQGLGMGGLLGGLALGGLAMGGKHLPGQAGEYFGGAAVMPEDFDPQVWGKIPEQLRGEVKDWWKPGQSPEQQIQSYQQLMNWLQGPSEYDRAAETAQ